ncbi:hypothetical protein HYH02_015558 [Chlamydomonas schloesseri]|uniref:Uncharacterized protein n=1 Tax=Chlamydomonas schloesseri TaxID=2026947 RepID=A0A835SAF3_9CHLO|nr:hypothetical protein HYH02_015558 [Chlamydomonas schloesseri]|eukprot:KAG2421981.1 hypothetical protein HYH02_015558 [Chlamydomonas schloesseri]
MYDVLLLGQLPDFPDLHWPTDGPGAANRSPAARRRDGPPPPPLSYAHALEVMGSCLWEPQATHAMFRALWCRGQNDMRMAVGELLRSWFEAWAYAAEAGMEAKARCKRGMLLAHEAWVRGVTALSDDDVRNVLVRLQLSELAANGGGWLGAELETVLDCLLGGGGSRGGGGGWAGAGAGAARLVSDVQVAEARAGLAAFAQDRGLTDVLAALPAYRPPAAALGGGAARAAAAAHRAWRGAAGGGLPEPGGGEAGEGGRGGGGSSGHCSGGAGRRVVTWCGSSSGSSSSSSGVAG